MDFMKKNLILLLIFLIISLGTPACFIVVYPEGEDVAPEIKISPKAEIEMSDEVVRSQKGDMIAQLPQNWFFVDLGKKLDTEVFATAVNPDYNLSAVFSIMPTDKQMEKVIKKEGLIGAARISLDKRNKTSDSGVKLAGKYQVINAGTLQFAVYQFTTSGAINAKTAVFRSQMGVYYEFSLIPMIVNGNPLPPQDEIDKIFQSILATLKY